MVLYYAIHKGNKIGIFNTWNDCKKNITGYSNSIFNF